MAIDTLTQTACWMTRGRCIDPVRLVKGAVNVKVNLGCGLAVVPGWINVDASLNAFFASWSSGVHKVLYKLSGSNRYYSCEQYCALLRGHLFIHHDLAWGVPFTDASVDFIYSSHFLEHLMRHEAIHLLRETYRVLKVGGVVRICVPDLEFAVSLYHKGEKERTLRNYFFVEDKASYYARHKYMYDFELLKMALEGAGFVSIERRSYQKGRVPDLDVLDNRPEDTLFVEAIKC